ncbi:nucleotidyltransferase family protein [Phormidesmis priestleyi]
MQTTPVQTKAQVLSLLQEYQQELHCFGVSRCGVFGSFVRDSAIGDQSDVDILVAFEPDQKTFDNFMHLSFFLEDLFGRAIDLVTIESLSPHIGPHILDEVEYVSIGSRVSTAHS